MLIYLEIFEDAYDPFFNYNINISTVKTVSDKSSMYLANRRYHNFTNEDNGKLYKQKDHLDSKVYIKNGDLFIDSSIRLIDDMVLNETGKLKRTKNNLYKHKDKLINNEFVEVSKYRN
ncbi:hypothetical protein [Pedobacter alpinus]|uniref:Uncharacterized protein n=1 Tax=Pedobacter alpinus TaxID=1590643 RepID=A0ABW5TT48_9SPHI